MPAHLLLVLAAAALPAVAQAAPQCDLVLTHEGAALVTIEASASGAPGSGGGYTLTVISEGVSGRSVTRQSGPYTVSADGSAPLALSSVGLGPGDAVEAALVVESKGIRRVCTERMAPPA